MERKLVSRSVDRAHYAQLPRHPLIVCAVLVQNPTNLGGLCRTCEVFRLEALVMSDEAIAEDWAFRNVASSAHHWQPLRSCSLDALPEWLQQQQQDGYSLVALDVDCDAVPLAQFAFPVRSILVLGQELTGIPAPILSVCDHVVSIPQFGLVESLNVQTAGAIAIYEYAKQHITQHS